MLKDLHINIIMDIGGVTVSVGQVSSRVGQPDLVSFRPCLFVHNKSCTTFSVKAVLIIFVLESSVTGLAGCGEIQQFISQW